MIDGIKIDVNSLNGGTWLSNKLLHFHTYTSVDTGELLDGTIVAKYRGLKFFITKSTKYENRIYYSVRGSLHKYFNNGKHNANDFSFYNLQDVIKELQQKFNINPKTSNLRNIEFGVNINTQVIAKEVLKNLVCFGKHTFGLLKIEGVIVGKRIAKQQSSLKIYDKGKQYEKAKNLVRFEVAVHKMIYLKKFNIVTLSDLQDASNIEPLKSVLLTYWDDVIYYDKKINWKRLTEFERKKILYYATPRNWSDFEIKQRYRAKKHFKELMRLFSTSTTHKDVYNLITEKWNDLTAEICPQINHDLKGENENRNVHKLTVRIHSYSVDKTISKNTISICPENTVKNQPNLRTKKRNCKTCKNDISHKRVNAKYCSKKCNNKANGKKRTEKNRQRIIKEKENLKLLLIFYLENELYLLVSYKTDTGVYTDNLQQKEITTTKDWIKKVVKVVATGCHKKTNTIILTSYRARRLIQVINNKNTSHNKNGLQQKEFLQKSYQNTKYRFRPKKTR